MIRSNFIVLFLAGCLAPVSLADAQMWSDANGNPVIHTNSDFDFSGGPVFSYYQADGVFTVENVGPNGVVDSPDNATLQGDDYGLISFIITADEIPGNQATTLLPLFDAGVLWNTFFYFNDKVQLAGSTTPDGQFLPVSLDETPLFQLPAGLDADDFRNSAGDINIETGINFAEGLQGATLFSVGDPLQTGAFRIIPVPEPGTMPLLMTAILGMAGLTRRRVG